MSNRTREILTIIAHEQGGLDGHAYHATWTPGHAVCLDCGKQRAVYPVCVPQWPDTPLALHLCPKHRPKEEAR